MSPINVLDPPTTNRTIPVPHTLELTVLFREFMAYWTGLKTEILDWGKVQSPVTPVELMVHWKGTVKGTLVVRTTQGLLDKLMEVFQEKGVEINGSSALFKEMVTLYAIFLVHYMCADEFLELGPILARPSQPKDWPPLKESHSFCAVGVDHEPVEIRLWIDSAENIASKAD